MTPFVKGSPRIYSINIPGDLFWFTLICEYAALQEKIRSFSRSKSQAFLQGGKSDYPVFRPVSSADQVNEQRGGDFS